MTDMTHISASVLSADFSQLGEELKSAASAGCDSVHVDVMDGVYVPNFTFGALVTKFIKESSPVPVHVHLMVARPEEHVEAFGALGVASISFHAETTYHPHRLISRIRALGPQAGIVLNPGFDFGPLLPLLPMVDMVTVMSVNPGFGGQSFIESQLEVIRAIRAYVSAHDLKVNICVDGGVNLKTAPSCVEAGASMLVMGHAFFGLSVPSRAAFIKDVHKGLPR